MVQLSSNRKIIASSGLSETSINISLRISPLGFYAISLVKLIVRSKGTSLKRTFILLPHTFLHFSLEELVTRVVVILKVPM